MTSKMVRNWTFEKNLLVEAREDQFILRECASSLMSDTKWRKLIAAISAPEIYVPSCVVKFINAPKEWGTATPHERAIRTVIHRQPFRPLQVQGDRVARVSSFHHPETLSR